MDDAGEGAGALRRCGRCGEEKALDNFAWRRRKRGQRDNYCRTCRSHYKREHYQKNKERYVANAARRRQRVLVERVTWLVDYLMEHPCVDCGEADVVVLDFDHVGDDKAFDVSRGIRDRPWKDVLAELAKCEVVCANCHRRRTAARGGHLRAAVAQW